MKKIFKRIMSMFLAVVIVLASAPLAGFVGLELPDFEKIFAVKANAATEYKSGSYTYTVDKNGNATIIDCDYLGGNVVVPATIDGYRVKTIGEDCFKDFRAVVSVTVSEGIEEINSDAFWYCQSLAKVALPDSLRFIGDGAFANCEQLSDIKVPDSVTELGSGVLSNTAYFNDVSNWKNGVLINGCHILDTDGSLSGTYAVNEKIKTIAGSAFRDSEKLTRVLIPDNVIFIGAFAFAGLESLEEIVVSNGDFKRIDHDAFVGTAYYNDEKNWKNGALYIGEILIEVKEEVSGLFTVEDGTRTIANWAFAYCESISKISIPNSVNSIGRVAFMWCKGLKSIAIPANVERIELGTFNSCDNLEQVIIPKSVKYIGAGAFGGNKSLKDVYYVGTQADWEKIYREKDNYTDYLDYATIHYNYIYRTFEEHFIAKDHKKRTKRADVMPTDKMGFVEKIINNELENAPEDKANKIQNKIYKLFFDATYRPTEFGGKTRDIEKWPHQNSGDYGTSVFDSGLGETIKWSKPGKGCCSYARFCSQYIHGTNGAYNNTAIISSCKNGSEIKALLLNYIDPGESIHYYYDGTQHWVVYIGSDNDGFYFLTYEGGSSKSGNNHILHLEYVTYDRLAETCKNKRIEVWDTNGGSYKMKTAEKSNHKSTTILFKFNALVEMYIDEALVYTNIPTNRNGIGTQATSTDEYKVTLSADEKHDIKIIGESMGTFDCKITYSMSDGQQNTREFVGVPLEVDKSVSTSISSCYDQGFLIVDNNNDQQIDEIWSAGINETSNSPLIIENEDSDIQNNEIILTPSTTTISYGDSMILHVDGLKIPEGGCVEWTTDNANFTIVETSDDGKTCTVTPSVSGETTFTATVCDADGNAVGTDTQTMTAKAGFFQKIIAFFKKLFGLTKIIPEVFRSEVR